MTLTLTRPQEAHTLTSAPLPALRVVVPTEQAAQRQFWRHVANRLCLAILADAREPLLTARTGSTDPTRAPNAEPRTPVGSDVFRVQVESIELQVGSSRIVRVTEPLDFPFLVHPSLLPGVAQRLALATLRGWPAPTTTEPLFPYMRDRQQFRVRPGLSGDMVALFETLLAPHAALLLDAMEGLRRLESR
ncbi:hypothetical protein [Deinococcus sp. DB0503]|uniref:hypothetical protein n=1 Tax=Deinococcus sp. DB0503 TaxID=2479203 RepID=UPI0018E01560|nr:hypothetical protein [Deinococcus sp. DB0503]MBI0447196.1 hypothetical protein [Deinococcus sp. DB0503]